MSSFLYSNSTKNDSPANGVNRPAPGHRHTLHTVSPYRAVCVCASAYEENYCFCVMFESWMAEENIRRTERENDENNKRMIFERTSEEKYNPRSYLFMGRLNWEVSPVPWHISGSTVWNCGTAAQHSNAGKASYGTKDIQFHTIHSAWIVLFQIQFRCWKLHKQLVRSFYNNNIYIYIWNPFRFCKWISMCVYTYSSDSTVPGTVELHQ